MAVKHKFVSGKSDGADATRTRPSNWNADHDLTGGTHGDRLIRDTTASDGAALAGFEPIMLTNGVGETHAVGDVVTVASGADTSTAYHDVLNAVRPYLVAQQAAANGASAIYARAGRCSAKVTGTVTRGNWLVKSATNKCLQDSGVAQTVAPPIGACAIALQSAAGPGVATITVLLVGATIPGIVQDGGTIPSAAALDVSSGAQAFHVSGTTGITSISSRSIGTLLVLTFDAVTTLTYHATQLKLQAGVNYTTAAGDTLVLKSEGSGNWREIGRSEVGVVGRARLGTGSVGDGTRVLRDNGTWGTTAIDPETLLELYEDFLGYNATSNTSNYPWRLISGAPGTQAVNGVIRVTGDGANQGDLNLSWNAIATVATPFSPPKNPTLKVRWAQVTATAGTRRIGLTSALLASGDPSNGIFFRHTAGGNILAVCRSGGSESTLDTTIAAADGVFHTGRLVVSGDGTLVTVFVDGVQRGTINSNIPSAALGLGAAGGVTTSGVGLDVDYFHVTQTR